MVLYRHKKLTGSRYTIEQIKDSFEKYYRENGHYPSAPEVDMCIYLPSTRQIQRRFGGIPKLRKILGINDTHLGAGEFRVTIAKRSNERGFKAERDLEIILIKHFGKPFVHIERPLDGQGKSRFDFYVFALGIEFGVDIFCSDTDRNIQNNINSKLNIYRNISVPIFLVLGNESITQELLDNIVMRKQIKPLPSNMKLLTLENFIIYIKKMSPFLNNV